MADTGAPWNIPYVENADLVKDYPTASLALANAVDGGLDTLLAGGIGTNVVSATKTDTFSTTSTTFGTITDLSVTITPSSATSKILVITSVNIATTPASNYGLVKMRRGATDIGIGTPVGNRIGVLSMTAPTSAFSMTAVVGVHLDSPATTSATTYDVQLRSENANVVYVNRSVNDRDASTDGRGASFLTVIEVAG